MGFFCLSPHLFCNPDEVGGWYKGPACQSFQLVVFTVAKTPMVCQYKYRVNSIYCVYPTIASLTFLPLLFSVTYNEGYKFEVREPACSGDAGSLLIPLFY